MSALMALGPYVFRIAPLTLQKIEEETLANWPVIARFGRAPARQFTGMGEGTIKIEGLYFNEEFGGHADYLALKGLQQAGQPIEMIGWGAGASFAVVMGSVVILKIGATHEAIGPDGIGRKTAFNIELGAYGEEFGGGLF
jgi:uncharacterized protein